MSTICPFIKPIHQRFYCNPAVFVSQPANVLFTSVWLLPSEWWGLKCWKICRKAVRVTASASLIHCQRKSVFSTCLCLLTAGGKKVCVFLRWCCQGDLRKTRSKGERAEQRSTEEDKARGHKPIYNNAHKPRARQFNLYGGFGKWKKRQFEAPSKSVGKTASAWKNLCQTWDLTDFIITTQWVWKCVTLSL